MKVCKTILLTTLMIIVIRVNVNSLLVLGALGNIITDSKFFLKVQVQIDQLLSRCESTSSCEFEWTEDATPQVTGIEPQTGVTSGSTITITGNIQFRLRDIVFAFPPALFCG